MQSRLADSRSVALTPLVAAVLIVQLLLPGTVLAQAGAPVQQSGTSSTAPQAAPIPVPAAEAPQPMDPGAAESETRAAITPDVSVTPTQAASLTQDERILQLLNRFTYGLRPGDLERVRAMGINAWLIGQFNPWRLDDSALNARLADYPAMQLPIERLMDQYPNHQMIRARMSGHFGAPHDEAEKAIYRAQTERYEDKQDKRKKGDAAEQARDSSPQPLPEDASAILALDVKARFSALCRLSPAQIGLLRRGLSPDQRDQITAGFTPRQIEELAAVSSPQGLVANELVQTKLLRDIYSERQLNEIMVDFWLNHFNVYMKKSEEAPYFIASFERDTIRPRALGHFEDLLKATAISPAMLNYLDNASSVGPHSPSVEAEHFQADGSKTASGLNENYAREVMELHTLGVNGGYTQKDVTELAKVFTGWTLVRGFGQEGGPAIHPAFDISKHEPGTKTVLGVKIKQDGPNEGWRVIHMLATSPRTAQFICHKLAVRFVSDDPPPALVDRMAQSFLSTSGDIRLVLLTMVQSPEFFARATFRDKVKTPQDYVVSAIRASGAEVMSASALASTVSDLGMPLYGMQTPNGYSMRADPWNNTAALISRMNFALALSSNRVSGVRADWPALVGPSGAGATPLARTERLEDKLLHQKVSDRTRATILSQITQPPDQQQATLRQIATKNGGRDALTAFRVPQSQGPGSVDPATALAAGLLFGSPEFQRR